MSAMFTVGGEQIAPYLERAKRYPQPPVRERTYSRPRMADEIIAQTARDHAVSVTSMLSDVRWREVAYARFDAFTRLRQVTFQDGSPRFSLPHIGWLLGGRDHSTVINGLRRWAKIQSAKREAEAA